MVESRTFHKVKELIKKRDILISSHRYDELSEDSILVSEVLSTTFDGVVLEDIVMHSRRHTKFLHEGKHVAEVEVNIIDNKNGWSPYISLDDVLKLDTIRELLRDEKISQAKKYAKVYILKPVL